MNRILSVLTLFTLSACLSSCSILKFRSGKKEKTIAIADTTTIKSDTTSLAHTPAIIADTSIAVATPPTTVTPPVPPVPNPMIEQLAPLWKNRLQYQTFSGKAKARFEAADGNGNDFTANFRIRKDSVIWINISALGGLFSARIFVTPDSFFMTIPVKREAHRIALKDAAKILPARVDFFTLQNLVLGEPLRDGAITDAAMSQDTLFIKVEDTAYVQTVLYSSADSAMRRDQLIHRNGAPQATADYRDYESANNRKISKGRTLSITNGGETYRLYLDFTNFTFDEPLEYPFSIPKNYHVE